MLIQVIFFRGDDHVDLPLVRQLVAEYRTKGVKSLSRLAPVFDGDVEECERVVLLPLVHPHHAARITAAYAAKGIPVERLADEDGPVETTKPDETVIEEQPTERGPMPLDSRLRRYSNRQLRDLATERGITRDDTQDRASLIAAIVAAAKENPP